MKLVYLSPVPWASFSQRPHKFVEWFQSKYQAEVLWIDPYPTRFPTLQDFQRIRSKRIVSENEAKEFKPPPWLKIVCPSSLPIEPLPGGGFLNSFLWHGVFKEIDQFIEAEGGLIGIGKPSALALQILQRYPDEHSFYDAMDYFPAFYKGLSRLAMEKHEEKIASLVSRLMVTSTQLANRFSAHFSKMIVVQNACAVESLPPINIHFNKSKIPVLGYVGTIGHWFDWPLALRLAKEYPTMHIRLIGPAYVLPEDPLPKNISLLMPCDNVAALAAMQEFSVGLIPFRKIDLTAYVDPIKYYEYLALGLPVISTRFGEMAMRDNETGVFIANSHSEFAGMVKAALAHDFKLDEVQNFRKANSWSARFAGSGFSLD